MTLCSIQAMVTTKNRCPARSVWITNLSKLDPRKREKKRKGKQKKKTPTFSSAKWMLMPCQIKNIISSTICIYRKLKGRCWCQLSRTIISLSSTKKGFSFIYHLIWYCFTTSFSNGKNIMYINLLKAKWLYYKNIKANLFVHYVANVFGFIIMD